MSNPTKQGSAAKGDLRSFVILLIAVVFFCSAVGYALLEIASWASSKPMFAAAVAAVSSLFIAAVFSATRAFEVWMNRESTHDGRVRAARAVAAYQVVASEERAMTLLELARVGRKWGYPLRIDAAESEKQQAAVRALLALSRAVSLEEACEVAPEIRLDGHEALATDAAALIALCGETKSDPRRITELPGHRASPISDEARERIRAEYERNADRPSAVLLQNVIMRGSNLGLRLHSSYLTNCSLNAIESAARLRLAMAGVIDSDRDYGLVLGGDADSRLHQDAMELANNAEWQPSAPIRQR